VYTCGDNKFRVILANSPQASEKPSNQARQAALRTQILLFALTVSIGLFLFDLFHIRGLMPGGIPFYALLFGGIGVALYLNRAGHYTTSSCVALVTLNAVIFAFSMATNGLLPLFIPVGVGALVIIPFAHTTVRWGFVFFSYSLFCISLFTDLEIFPSDVDASGESVLLFVSATTAIVCLVVILQFYMSLTRATEASLKGQRQQLLQLTDDLQRSQDRLRLVIQGSRAGIYEWNVKSNALYISNEWKQILGYSPHELTDFGIADLTGLMHPDDLPELHRKIKEHFEEQKPFQNESRRRHKNGSYRWIYDSGLSKLDANGNIEVVVGSIIDITERKSAELLMANQNEWLKKTNQELDRLVHNASHDLRSPLSSVLGLLTIAEHAGSRDEIYAYHGMIRERVRKLDNFVTEVLAYSRNSNHEVVKVSVALPELINEIVDELKYADDRVSIDISPAVSSNHTVITDHTRLKTVLRNLIGNSIKYCDPRKDERYIRVSTLLDSDTCTITVHDNGIGIAAEHRDKVFEMFYRATENSSGSGLGLFITKEIVEKLGGTIGIISTPRVGTTVFVKLPAS
jgi:PAS domain S-box-containing protein